ncbi:NAD(P)/FAD-dependent oxidoreductase [Nocardia panacis]|uniref:NAD(P)/FAD-dependent oxidoreductase n=1 Tax=Nocardia panacis TaxID=2340916 RepID=A0A3A4KH09_9NOCA|nr:NAD(P)/FAD-dependent oxidoreductase [Nocardia panacis]RJO68235.1 NAD(P)/FAD-dependent oxidoreductase [Nocardia panacis]
MTTAEEHIDVLIVGAGLSGIGAAHHLSAALPDRTYLVLEARDTLGGTWDLFRYPGIRSDSDMYTLGYRFRPWLGDKSIADGADILAYLRDTAAEAGIDRHIRYGHRVVSADWSSAENRWHVRAEHAGETVEFTAEFLWGCTGYYSYDTPYTPDFEGVERFSGPILHPQRWPRQLDVADKRVVLIGSGATAVTLAPALTAQGAHVTILQRSPSYIISAPERDEFALKLRRHLPPRLAYALARAKNIALSTAIYQLSQRYPARMRRKIRSWQQRWLPEGFDIDTHFTPRYNPWDQRLCLAPNGDFFRAIRKGALDLVTDRIAHFTESGLHLASGADLDADIVITATGLNLLAFGGARLAVDGAEVVVHERMAYKSMMLSDVPNFVYVFGYTNASWTLKADLVSEYVIRLLRHMAAHGYARAVPVRDPAVGAEPLFAKFNPGYVQRGAPAFPIQGDRWPWQLRMNYLRDRILLGRSPIADGTLRFERAGSFTTQ